MTLRSSDATCGEDATVGVDAKSSRSPDPNKSLDIASRAMKRLIYRKIRMEIDGLGVRMDEMLSGHFVEQGEGLTLLG